MCFYCQYDHLLLLHDQNLLRHDLHFYVIVQQVKTTTGQSMINCYSIGCTCICLSNCLNFRYSVVEVVVVDRSGPGLFQLVLTISGRYTKRTNEFEYARSVFFENCNSNGLENKSRHHPLVTLLSFRTHKDELIWKSSFKTKAIFLGKLIHSVIFIDSPTINEDQ